MGDFCYVFEPADFSLRRFAHRLNQLPNLLHNPLAVVFGVIFPPHAVCLFSLWISVCKYFSDVTVSRSIFRHLPLTQNLSTFFLTLFIFMYLLHPHSLFCDPPLQRRCFSSFWGCTYRYIASVTLVITTVGLQTTKTQAAMGRR